MLPVDLSNTFDMNQQHSARIAVLMSVTAAIIALGIIEIVGRVIEPTLQSEHLKVYRSREQQTGERIFHPTRFWQLARG